MSYSNALDKDETSIVIRAVFDPDSQDWECREFDYLVTVVHVGYWRARYFNNLAEATAWGCDKLLELYAIVRDRE